MIVSVSPGVQALTIAIQQGPKIGLAPTPRDLQLLQLQEYMEYQSVMDRDDLIDGDLGEMGDYSVVELLVEQAEAIRR